jgi:hypothetical protein
MLFELFGGEMSEACEFGSIDEASEIVGLMMRQWNTIAATLFEGGNLRAPDFQPDAQPDEGLIYKCLQVVSSPCEPV